MRLWQMKNNRHHSENQAQHLPPRPDTGGTAGIENSSNRAVVAITCGIYFREEGQETCYVYETVKLNIYRK